VSRKDVAYLSAADRARTAVRRTDSRATSRRRRRFSATAHPEHCRGSRNRYQSQSNEDSYPASTHTLLRLRDQRVKLKGQSPGMRCHKTIIASTSAGVKAGHREDGEK